MFLGSTLNEYCTVLNIDDAGNSRRMRTQSAVELSAATCALPVCRKSTLPDSVERPRSTSKSELNFGSFGTWASAAAISFCSSAEGVHTFSTFTFTGGCPACCAATHTLRLNTNKGISFLGNTAAFYQAIASLSSFPVAFPDLESEHGKSNARLRNAAAAFGRGCRSRRGHHQAEERPRRPCHHAC